MQYTAIFHGYKNVNVKPSINYFSDNIFNSFLIFAQNIDCGHTLEPPHAQSIDCGYTLSPPQCLSEAVLTSTHYQWFEARIRKKCIPL